MKQQNKVLDVDNQKLKTELGKNIHIPSTSRRKGLIDRDADYKVNGYDFISKKFNYRIIKER